MSDAGEELAADLTDDQISAFISDPATISTHEIALQVIDVLEHEIADIQAQVDTAQIESNAKPLSPDRQAWLRRAAYAAAMRRNERHKIMQRDKELRGTKRYSKPHDPDKKEANLVKQQRLMADAETRREEKRQRLEGIKTQQMQLANAKYEMQMKNSRNHRFVEAAKRVLPADLYRVVCVATDGGKLPDNSQVHDAGTVTMWSEREDSNLRPPRPERGSTGEKRR